MYKNIDLNLIKSMFYVDSTSPSGLRRSTDSFCGRYSQRKVASAGDVAGYLSKNGYYIVEIAKKKYRAHRLVLAMRGSDLLSTDLVDHEDGDKTNNSEDNIRPVDTKVNGENKSMRTDNTSGTTGVCWRTKKRGLTYAEARWKEGGKGLSKAFSVAQHGLLVAFKLAALYRASRIAQLNASGRCYTERHGL